METVAHLKTSTSFINKENNNYSKLVIDKFIESCMHLDASIFEPFMAEDDVFQDKEKYKFLSHLKMLFQNCRNLTTNDFHVNFTREVCRGCQTGKPVLGFLIDLENGILKDIFKCQMYKKHHAPF